MEIENENIHVVETSGKLLQHRQNYIIVICAFINIYMVLLILRELPIKFGIELISLLGSLIISLLIFILAIFKFWKDAVYCFLIISFQVLSTFSVLVWNYNRKFESIVGVLIIDIGFSLICASYLADQNGTNTEAQEFIEV